LFDPLPDYFQGGAEGSDYPLRISVRIETELDLSGHIFSLSAILRAIFLHNSCQTKGPTMPFSKLWKQA
jgi:hypothetical protein